VKYTHSDTYDHYAGKPRGAVTMSKELNDIIETVTLHTYSLIAPIRRPKNVSHFSLLSFWDTL